MKKFNNFITLEGPEGSGKSTISKLMQKFLEDHGKSVVLTREPGGNGIKFAEEIREVIMPNGDIDLKTELLLFEASRSEHINKLIAPATKDGKIVICDRYMDSSTVYQGIVQGLGEEYVTKMNEITVGEYVPSITFLLDISPEIGLERIRANTREGNRFDEKDITFHQGVRQAYLKIAQDNPRFVKIDASKTVEETFEQIKIHLEKLI